MAIFGNAADDVVSSGLLYAAHLRQLIHRNPALVALRQYPLNDNFRVRHPRSLLSLCIIADNFAAITRIRVDFENKM